LNKQKRTVDKGWSFSLGVGRVVERLTTPRRKTKSLLRNITQSLRIGQIFSHHFERETSFDKSEACDLIVTLVTITRLYKFCLYRPHTGVL